VDRNDPDKAGTAAADGWFTGRRRVLDGLDRWLVGDEDRRARVVTGASGAGKSAVLEQLAWRHRADGLLDGVVYAQGRTLAELVEELAGLTGAADASAAAVLAAVRRRQRTQRVLLDGVDEAAEPDLLATELLVPLVALTWGTSTRRIGDREVTVPKADLRLVVGAGRELAATLAARGAAVVDLDADPRKARLEIAAYVLRRLLGDPASPYLGRSLQARRTARAVAARSRGSFFAARAVADLLVARPVPTEPRDLPYWRPGMELAGAFEATLAHRFGPDAVRARDLLRPLAYVEGTGLRRGELWASLAGALADREYGPDDVDWLLAEAGAYVVERAETDAPTPGEAGDGGGSGTVRRLRHRAIATALRGPDEAGDQAVLTKTLLAGVPAMGDPGRAGPRPLDWARADPYTRTHVAAHAAAAGRLGELLDDPMFLVAAPPGRLARLLPRGDHGGRDAGPGAEVYRRAAPRLTDGDLGGNAARLELAARCLGADELAARLGALPARRPWRPHWARWRVEPIGGPEVLPDGLLTSLATAGGLGGRVVLASGSADGQVRAWIPATGEPLGQPLRGHHGWVSGVAVYVPAEPLAIPSWLPERAAAAPPTAAAPGGLAGVPAGGPAGVPVAAGAARPEVPAAVLAPGEPLVVSAGQDGTIRAWALPGWALPGGAPVGTPLHGHRGWVTVVQVVTGPGRRPIVISGGDDGTIRVWDLAVGAPAVATFEAHAGWVSALAAAVLPDGRAVAVSAGHDRAMAVWDLAAGTRLRGAPAGSASWITALTLLTTESGRPAIAGGKSDGSMRLWDLESCEPLAPPFAAHTTGVTALTSTTLHDGRTVLVSGSHDRTIRVLDPSGACLQRIELDSGVHELAVTAPGQVAVAAGGGLCLIDLGPG
jgi:WD40 repeat protein